MADQPEREIDKFSIIVREKATKLAVHREIYEGQQMQAERRATDHWTCGGFSSGSNVGRYRLTVRRLSERRPFMTID